MGSLEKKSLLVSMPGGGTAPIIVTKEKGVTTVNLQRLPALNGELNTVNLIRFLRLEEACKQGKVKFLTDPYVLVHLPERYKPAKSSQN